MIALSGNHSRFYLRLFILCLPFILFTSGCSNSWRTEVQQAELHDVDLNKTDDGLYSGKHEYRDFQYKVEVNVKDHRIIEIQLVEWEENEARTKALDIFEKVIDNQSLCVDAVSGATTASKLYLLCVENALPFHLDTICPHWEYH